MKNDFETRRIMNDPIATLPLNLGDELVSALRNAVDLNMPVLFEDMVQWASASLQYRSIDPGRVTLALQAMRSNLKSVVPVRWIEPARRMIDASLERARLPEPAASRIDETTVSGKRARVILDALRNEADELRASRETLIALASGSSIIEIYEQILTPVLHEAGRLWQCDEITITQEHIITSAIERIMAQLIDMRAPKAVRDLTAITASIGSAQHEVGARMVADAFSLCGWQSTYLGSNLPVEDLLKYIDSVSVDVLALSATLSRDVVAIRDLIAELEARPVAPVVIVGGHPFGLHPSLWRAIGADGCANSPLAAVGLAHDLIHNCCE